MTLTCADRGTDTAGGVLETVSLPGGRTLTVRAVTHLDVNADACRRAAEVMMAAAERARNTPHSFI